MLELVWSNNAEVRLSVRQKIRQPKRGRGPAQILSGLCGVNSRGLGGIFTPYFEPRTRAKLGAG